MQFTHKEHYVPYVILAMKQKQRISKLAMILSNRKMESHVIYSSCSESITHL